VTGLSIYERCDACAQCDKGGCRACLGSLLDGPPPDPERTAAFRRQVAEAHARRDESMLGLSQAG
jgi:hypothetical protein